MLIFNVADEEFDELCFQFGIELDEITSEKKQASDMSGGKVDEDLSEEIIYKIEIPANRYDLLCLEGLVDALRVYLGKMNTPSYKVIPGSLEMKVGQETALIRPYVVCAVLRDIKFTRETYDSFIEMQDKLHNGLARHRTLISMGTHDLDTIEGPFRYEAKAPESIRFKPLYQDKIVDGHELIKLYEEDKKIRNYLHIIKDSPVFPVVLDAKDRVLSLPPLINSDHSKISLNTKNVFIEVTATDLSKAKVGLNMLVAAFSRYCTQPYTFESVLVTYPDGTSMVTPDMSPRTEVVSVEYINRLTGLKLSAEEICKLLSRMMLTAGPRGDAVEVSIPPVRSDVLHACDIMEDVAIAYGYSNLPKAVPKVPTFGCPLPINKLSDMVRKEVALAGFSEVLTFTLCSHVELFDNLRLKDDGKTAVRIANPKTLDFEVVHSTLIPQMLKTVHANKRQPLPIKIFQVLDVVLQCPNNDVGARNERHLCALYCAQAADFEIIHGLLDRVMLMLNVPLDKQNGYYIQEAQSPYFLAGRQATIYYNGKSIGEFGIVHPKVAAAFDAPYVSTLLELNLEPFL